MNKLTTLILLLSPAACTALPKSLDKTQKIIDVLNDGPAPLTESSGVEPPMIILLSPLLMGVVFVLSAYMRKK